MGETPSTGALTERATVAVVWLPAAVPDSVILDRFRCGGVVSRTSRGRVARATTADQAMAWAEMLARGDVANRSDLAERVGVSRARVTHVLGRATLRPRN